MRRPRLRIEIIAETKLRDKLLFHNCDSCIEKNIFQAFLEQVPFLEATIVCKFIVQVQGLSEQEAAWLEGGRVSGDEGKEWGLWTSSEDLANYNHLVKHNKMYHRKLTFCLLHT